jgi:hypothetical protein
MMIGLTSDERVAVLGEELRREFFQVVRTRNSKYELKKNPGRSPPGLVFL